MLRYLSFTAAFAFMTSIALAAGPVRQQKQQTRKPAAATAQQKRTPATSNVNACEDLTKHTQVCANVLSPTDSAPRSNKSMKDCYLALVNKRRSAMAARAACPTVDRSTAQIEDLRMLLARAESKEHHVSSSKGLEGFGLDLVGHLDGNHRTPASGN